MLSVSDHALVRYIERWAEIDLEPIRDDIRALADAGSQQIVIEGDAVVTVLGADMRQKGQKRKSIPDDTDEVWDAYIGGAEE